MRGRAPLEGELDATITASFPIPSSFSKAKRAAAVAGSLRPTTKPDFDNLAKTVDALNAIVWRDDALVVEARIRKFYSETPGLRIEIRTVGETVDDVFA